MTFLMAKCFMRRISCARFLSTTPTVFQKTSQKNENSRIRSYIMESYLRYMNYTEQILEKRFPAAMKIYKVFSQGTKSFFKDVKSFVVIRLTVISLNDADGFKDLTRKEIELYDKMPKDMIKISPVLFLLAIPFSNYVVFPLAYMYPHKLLTSHFWTQEQLEDFRYKDLQKRLEYGKHLFKGLNQYIPDIQDSYMKSKWCEIITELNFGKHPCVERIIECKLLFTIGPYSLRNLHYGQLRSLIRFHGLSFGLHPAKKLNQQYFILREMDKAIVREGGVNKMSSSEIYNACAFRGFHTCSLTESETKVLLNNWLTLSNAVEENCTSLLLHGPVLLGYNIPHHFIKSK